MLDMLRHDDALECEAGVVRLFGAGDIATQGMLGGWAGPEEGHNWNDGQEAALMLAISQPSRRLQLHLLGEPYVTRARPVQDLTVYGNGYRLGAQRMTARVDTAVTITLEPEWWFTRGHRVVMRLAFNLPMSVRPKDISDGPDGRELGFCFRSLCLRELAD
jgi:hypothetical protein